MKKYRFGISRWGVLAVAVVLLPNLLYLFAAPPNDLLADNDAEFFLWNLLENIGRIGLMAALVALCTPQRAGKPLLAVAALLLLAYYACWGLYFGGVVAGPVLLGLAVFPTLFFLLVAWMLKNTVALGFGLLFGVCHIAITASNFLF